MKKILKYLVIFIVFISFILFILLRQPAFQDRLLESAFKNMATPSSYLPEEDALTAVVCGSRAPIPAPDRAETCILIQAGENIFIFDTGGGSAQNLNDWNTPWDRVQGIFYTHLHSDHIFDIADFHQATWINGGRGSKQKVYGPEGVQMLTDGIELAYTKDYFFRNEHHGDTIAPLDIAGFDTHTINLDSPILVDDGSLKITAYSVSHSPVDPALGYRIDYKGRSVSIREDSHIAEPVDTRSHDDLIDNDLKPFIELKDKLSAVMTAHITYPDIDNACVSFSEIWLKNILQNNIGFSGVIFSDDLTMKGAGNASMGEKAIKAINAGCDMVLVCNDYKGANSVINCFEKEDIDFNSRIGMMQKTKTCNWDDLADNPRVIETKQIIKTLGEI
jgi:ribonuclease Z